MSPDTPALTTVKPKPRSSSRSWISDGKLCAVSRPSPAVRLSPRNTTAGRVSAAGATSTGAAAPTAAGGEAGAAALYATASVVLSVAALFLGLALVRAALAGGAA